MELEIFLGLVFVVIITLSIISLILYYITTKNNLETFNGEDQIKKLRALKIKITILSTLVIGGILGIFLFILFVIVEQSNVSLDKPLIYLYPESEKVVTVKLGSPENLTCTYPKYENSWKVLAKPSGDLFDLKTNRTIYGLYWEGKNTIKSEMKDGFCIKGENTAKFLEEKLSILGLSDREANEFIIYWLPKLEKNSYNLVRFQTLDEINEIMPLEISPKPDTIIRVLMEFKPLKQYIEVEEQKLDSIERNGFTVVEWGGTEIK